jgi:hypothetical protein
MNAGVSSRPARWPLSSGGVVRPVVRESVRTLLGPDEFEIANECGRALSQDDSVTVAASTVANPVKAG